jgi:hypothetical protein
VTRPPAAIRGPAGAAPPAVAGPAGSGWAAGDEGVLLDLVGSANGRHAPEVPDWWTAEPNAGPDYRCSVTPTCRHIDSSGQVEHFGRTPVQMNLPKGTNRSLISIQ